MLKRTELGIILAIVAIYMSLSSMAGKDAAKPKPRIVGRVSQPTRPTQPTRPHAPTPSILQATPQHILKVNRLPEGSETRTYQTAGTLAEIQGDALTTNRVKEDQWYSSFKGASIDFEERLMTGAGTSCAIDLSSGPWLVMSPDTRIEIHTQDDPARQMIELKEGALMTQTARIGRDLGLMTPSGRVDLGENSTCLATVAADGRTRLLVNGSVEIDGAVYNSRTDKALRSNTRSRSYGVRAQALGHGSVFLKITFDQQQQENVVLQQAHHRALFTEASQIDDKFSELAERHGLEASEGGR
jgi:hypothetical protein